MLTVLSATAHWRWKLGVMLIDAGAGAGETGPKPFDLPLAIDEHGAEQLTVPGGDLLGEPVGARERTSWRREEREIAR